MEVFTYPGQAHEAPKCIPAVSRDRVSGAAVILRTGTVAGRASAVRGPKARAWVRVGKELNNLLAPFLCTIMAENRFFINSDPVAAAAGKVILTGKV